MSIRDAYHAGSWYSSSAPTLTAQLDQWLADVPDELPGVRKTPIPGARVVISPHAGYAYSGPCAAWAYRSLDLSKAYVLSIPQGIGHTTVERVVLTSRSTGSASSSFTPRIMCHSPLSLFQAYQPIRPPSPSSPSLSTSPPSNTS